MKLIDAVNAFIAADEMSKQTWPYDLALALVKIKRAVHDDMTFFVQTEKELVLKYAELDEHNNVRLSDNGTFKFKDAAAAPQYERAHRELCNTSINAPDTIYTAKAPPEIKPAYIEALTGFLQLTIDN